MTELSAKTGPSSTYLRFVIKQKTGGKPILIVAKEGLTFDRLESDNN